MAYLTTVDEGGDSHPVTVSKSTQICATFKSLFEFILREAPLGPLGVLRTSERGQGPSQLKPNFCKTVSHKTEILHTSPSLLIQLVYELGTDSPQSVSPCHPL